MRTCSIIVGTQLGAGKNSEVRARWAVPVDLLYSSMPPPATSEIKALSI